MQTINGPLSEEVEEKELKNEKKKRINDKVAIN